MDLTNSQFTLFLTCPKKYQYEYIDKRVPVVEAEPLAFGSMVHSGLEQFWRGLELSTAQEAVKKFAEQTTARDKEILWQKADAMVAAYYDFYKEDYKNWDMIGAEVDYCTPVEGDVKHLMKADAVARNKKDGIIYLIEHKTTSLPIKVDSGESDYWLKLYVDTQITSYQVALEHHFCEPVSILYDVCKKHSSAKPKLKQGVRRKKDESKEDYEMRKLDNTETLQDFRERIYADIMADPSQYFERRVIPRTDQDRKEWKEDFLAIADDINRSKTRQHFPKNPGSCFRFGRCPYFNVCSKTDDLYGDNFRTKTKTNEELGATYERVPF